MEGQLLIRSIRLENILSFGPNTSEFPLEPLNVLIGPNASGKSNLIEALSLLHAAPRDLQEPIRQGGGVREWLWKGKANLAPTAMVEVTLGNRIGAPVPHPLREGNPHPHIVRSIPIPNYLLDDAQFGVPGVTPALGVPLRYRVAFTEEGARFELHDEVVETAQPLVPDAPPYLYYQYRQGRPEINVKGRSNVDRRLEQQRVKPDQSILSQRRDPESYPELTYLADQFERMSFYREWNLGRFTPPRLPQRPDLPQDRLLEDASNVGVVLSDLLNQPDLKEQILERMRVFYPSFRDVHVTVSGGTVQIFFHEKGLREAVPATRLSDGSLRYLCLLTVLLNLYPRRVVCIEEPELGLHPDIIPEVAKLLVEAAKRCQLFVTTHSDILVDALSDVPEAVVVCEKVDGATELRRLDRDTLGTWLEEYRLGELWSRGEIGGNRW